MNGSLSYSLAMLLALLVFWAVRWWCRAEVQLPLNRQQQLGLSLSAFIGGVLGAKLPFVFSAEVPWYEAAAWLTHGKTITTGLLGAYVSVEVTKFIWQIRCKTGDSLALPLACAMSVGRWGCFGNGCCYGTLTQCPWGVDFLGDGLRHPTQIYESMFHAFMALCLCQLLRHRWLVNHRLQFYLICYFSYRFLTEMIRPEPADWAGFTFYQTMSLIGIVGLGSQWLIELHLERINRIEQPSAL